MNYTAFEKEILPFKKYVFKYWDKNGPGHFKTIMGLFSIRPAARLVLHHWLIEWYGGEAGVTKILRQLHNKLFIGTGGSYNFKFYLKNSTFYDNREGYPKLYFDVVVDGYGDVAASTFDGVVYDHIAQAINDEGIGWEIDEEIRDIINDHIRNLVPGFDPVIDSMNVTMNFPSNLQ